MPRARETKTRPATRSYRDVEMLLLANELPGAEIAFLLGVPRVEVMAYRFRLLLFMLFGAVSHLYCAHPKLPRDLSVL